MTGREAEEQELIEQYRQYRQTPRRAASGTGTGTGMDAGDDVLSNDEFAPGAQAVSSEMPALSAQERAIIEDYRSYKKNRINSEQARSEHSDADLIGSIVEQCAPILRNTESTPSSARLEVNAPTPSRSFIAPASRWLRRVFEFLLAPSGALVATAVVAGIVLFPMLSGDHTAGGLATFSGSDAFSEELALARLSAYYPQSVTRTSTLPNRDNNRAYHYNTGRLVAGLAIAIKSGSVERGTLFSTQLARMVESDPEIDSAPVLRIQQLFSDSAESETLSETSMESLTADFDQLIDGLNTRELTSTEKHFEHLGAWTLGSRMVVRAATEKADVDEELYARFVDDFADISEKILETPDLLTRQRRSLTAYEGLIQDAGSRLSEADEQHLISVSKSLDEIHIAYKN